MTREALIAALTLGPPQELERALAVLIADPDPDEALVQLGRRRLNRLGFDLDDPRALQLLEPHRQAFFARFGR
jgi:hypothetical protein